MNKILLIIVLINFFNIANAENTGSELSPSQVVTKAYKTFSAGDMEGWSALHSDDLTFTILGDLPQSGIHKGTKSTIEGVFEVLPVHWPGFNLTELNRYTLDNTVIVHLKMTADGLETESLHKFEVIGGKISSFIAFDDTQSMFLAMKKNL
tara:strand:- start:75 stop:527 length:453 start_codon:yes stop_codon:yes gene_type:complete